ncbi:MAG: hypothetical protein GF311_01290 [Candidatus Lokiarchaeota archaeon]|nr:hypothetical protein [Candidatus Lokiarchaeota archaeon]
MRDIDKIRLKMKENSEEIIENIPQIEIDLYNFIQNQFQKLNKNPIHKKFKKVFKVFYGQGINFIQNYFDTLFDSRLNKRIRKIDNIIDLKSIFEEILDSFYGDSGKNQYSYTSKLIHTINTNFPIYDSNVKEVFGFKSYYDCQLRRKEFFDNVYKKIYKTYSQIIEKNLIKEIVEKFSKERDVSKLNSIKKIDFLFWGMGKFIKKNKEMV